MLHCERLNVLGLTISETETTKWFEGDDQDFQRFL